MVRRRRPSKYFKENFKTDNKDELIFYYFATVLYKKGQIEKADLALKKGLEVNPDYEPILCILKILPKCKIKQMRQLNITKN